MLDLGCGTGALLLACLSERPDATGTGVDLALDGGDDGLDCWRAVLPRIAAGLSRGGRACLEIGAGQEDAVLGLAARAGLCEIGREKDLAGICRCLVLGLADNPATGASG